jgi:hypothetical protein
MWGGRIALDGGEWSASRPIRFSPGTRWIGEWIGSGAVLDAMEQRKF